MEEFSPGTMDDRFKSLSTAQPRQSKVNMRYSAFVRKLRFILPLIALVMTVVVLTWDEAGQRIEPAKKEDVIPASENIQNELLKPIFNGVDEKNQPYTVTADRAVQNRQNAEVVELQNPAATLQQNDGNKLEGTATLGLYEQDSRKLNLEGNVRISHTNGYTLSTEELRIDMVTQKAYSGRDVKIEGPDGTLEATGLEGDANDERIIFNGPAKVVVRSDSNLFSPKEATP